MIWNAIRTFLQDLDKRITDNISSRGERWVHDPDEMPPVRNQEAGTTTEPAQSRNDPRAREREANKKERRASWQRGIA